MSLFQSWILRICFSLVNVALVLSIDQKQKKINCISDKLTNQKSTIHLHPHELTMTEHESILVGNNGLNIVVHSETDPHKEICEQPSAHQPDPSPGGLWPSRLRNPLARAMFEKMREDERNRNDRHVYWYRVIKDRLSEEHQGLFLQCDQEKGTDLFLENCQEKSDEIFSQLFHSVARPLLSFFMAQTSINGLLNRGSMFIFSKDQFEKLMRFSAYHKAENLLDLGAGDGKVTLKMSTYFNNTYVTEMSNSMVRRLQGHGYKVLGVSEWAKSGLTFDLVTCLNLLDRCDKPMTLLAEMKAVLKPLTGRVLVAVVIPFKPFVEFGSRNNEPSEYIHINGNNFEEQVEHFFRIFHQAGFEVEQFTRLPYLCEGDLKHSFYVLTDALFVLKPVES